MLNRPTRALGPAPYLHPPVILMADDDVDDRSFFEEALGFVDGSLKLVMVKDGEELIDYLRSFPIPDLIFLDLNMPRKNGGQCLAYIKKDALLSGIPVVILSTSIGEAKQNQLIEEGASCCFNKPTEFSALVAILKKAMLLLTSAALEASETPLI